jgi:transcriptional regulator with XRE-family HTH domain
LAWQGLLAQRIVHGASGWVRFGHWFHYNAMMSTIMEVRETEAILASNLRMEREARGWTLAGLAARSGVSRAMLSKIERCEASPTAALLGRLSAAFGLTMSQLFARIEDQPGSQVARADRQPVWRDPDTGFLRRALSPPGSGPLELVWGELPSAAEITYPAASRSFIADQQLVVISGDLTIILGAASHVLEAGDCLRFGPPKEATFRNPGAARCRYVIALLRVTEYHGLRRVDNGSVGLDTPQRKFAAATAGS